VPSANSSTIFAQKAGQIVRSAAGDQALVDHDLLVHPVAAGVSDVGAQARPPRELPNPHDVRLDERPRTVADDADGLPFSKPLTNRTASSSILRKSGLATPPGRTSAS
jgi:hypothetical protein